MKADKSESRRYATIQVVSKRVFFSFFNSFLKIETDFSEDLQSKTQELVSKIET
jgi:hypothetical protein